jgi:hypothetical protein
MTLALIFDELLLKALQQSLSAIDAVDGSSAGT